MATSLLWLALLGSAHGAEGVLDRVAAVVNDDVIALSEIYELGSDFIKEGCPNAADAPCHAAKEREVLDALLRETLERQELQRLKMDVTPGEVDQQIQQILVQYGFADRDAFRDEVERQGLSWADYRRLQVEGPLRQQRFQESVLRGRVTVSDDEVKDAYQRAVRTTDGPEVARIEAFGYRLPDPNPDVLAAKVVALRAALADVRAGARTWADLASTWDTAGVGPAFQNGSFKKGDLADPLSSAAFDTAVGDYSEPVIVNGVLYAVHVLGREKAAPDVAPLDAVRDQLMQQLFEKKMAAAAEEWFEAAKRRAAIRILLDDAPASTDAPAAFTPEPKSTP